MATLATKRIVTFDVIADAVAGNASGVASAIGVALPVGLSVVSVSPPQHIEYLPIASNAARTVRITLTAKTADTSLTMSLVREVALVTDGSGTFTITQQDLFYSATGGAWTPPVEGVSPHLLVTQLAPGTAEVQFVGIDGHEIAVIATVESI